MRMVGGGGPRKLLLAFFLSSFFLLSGQVIVLVTSGFVHGMSPGGAPRWARVGSVVGLLGSVVVVVEPR